MSKAHPFLSLTATVGLLILAGGVGIWALPLRALAQAASVGSPSAEKEKSPLIFTPIQPITQVKPVYPREAKRAGIQGNVRLRVTINKTGSVMDIQVLSGHPQLVKAVLEAVSQWRYSPNKVVRVTVVTVNFSLDKAGAGAPAQHVSGEPPPLPKQSASDWVPFTTKQVERLYVPSSSGEKLVRESTEWVARDSDGSFFFADVHGLRRGVLDGRTGDNIEIDYERKTATLHRRDSPAPLQPPTGEEYKHVPPERSLGTRMISGVECIGIKEPTSRGDEQTTETWVAPSLNFEVVETTVLSPGVPSARKLLGNKKILSEVVLEDIQVGRRPDRRLFRIPEGFQKVYFGPL